MLGLGARLGRLGALLALCALSFAASAAQLVVVIDTDNNVATGCTITTPAGNFVGAEVVLTTTVNTATNPPTVGAVTQQTCVTPPATLSAPIAVSPGGWNVGVGTGVAGFDVIETFIPMATPHAVYRVGAYYTDAAGTDVLFTVGGAIGGGAIILAAPFGLAPTLVPTLSDAGIFLLALLLFVAAARTLRKHQLPTTLVVGLFAVILTSAAMAAIVLDGLIADWTGTPPLTTDQLGDAPGGTDISALFARIETNKIFFRADVKIAGTPNAAADTYSTTLNTPLTVPANGVLTNDFLGLPAATLTSFGGGGAGGTPTSFAPGATANFGGTGSLTVNANGSFTYTPVTGFTGVFTFSYVITNVSGTSTGLVTINTNQAAAITSANNTTFIVGQANTFAITTTGFPTPAVTFTGCAPALPAGVGFVDNGNGSGTLSGNPPPGSGGAYVCTVTATNSGGPATQPFTLNVVQRPLITSANSTVFTTTGPGTFTVTTTGFPTGASMAISETGALPPGTVTFVNNNDGTATLAGTPTAGGIYPITITANNGVAPAATQAFTLTVTQPPTITSANNTTFAVGVPNSFSVTTTGFPLPSVSFSGCVPAPPPTVGFVDNANGTGTLLGTPTAGQTGTFNCTVGASNGFGAPALQPFTLTIQDTPIAVNDAYSVAHDTTLNVAAGTGLLSNDSGIPAPTVVEVTGTGPTCTVFACVVNTANGTVIVAADGSLSYTPNALFAGTDTFTYSAGNVQGTSPAATVTITVTNVIPVVDLNGPAGGIDFGPATFTEGAAPVAIVDAAQLVIGDTDSANLASATVTITNPLDQPNETLGLTCSAVPPACVGAIQLADIVYTPATGTLVITSNAPLADYALLLRTLTYSNLAQDPDATQRLITVVVNDGIADSSPAAQATVNVAAVNDPPTITAPLTVVTNTNTAHTFAGTVSVADPDADTSPVKVTLTSTNGTATLSTTAGLTVIGNGSASVVSTGPLTAQNTALNNMLFTPTPAFSGAASLKIDIDDQGNTGTGGPLTATKTVAITVDNAPTVASTVPVNGATNTGLNPAISVTFSEAVTVTASAFTLNCPAAQAFTVLPASPATTFNLTPTLPLPAGSTCTLTVVANQVTDSVAQNMVADYTTSFTTDTLPTVLSTSPTNGATAVALGATVTVNFSESVNVTGASFTIACPAAQPFTFLPASPAASFVLTPTSALPAGSTCTVTVVAAQVTDADATQNMTANYVFSFQTATPAAFNSATSTKFTVGVAGTFSVTTTGGNPTPVLTRTGTLPANVTFVDNGNGTATLAGTPAAGTDAGSPYAQIFTATNAGGAPTQNFSLVVCPVISATPGVLPNAVTTNNYSQALAGNGGSAPYTFALASGSLPTGMTLSGAGLLSATPVTGAAGGYTFDVTVTDNIGCVGTTSYSLTVDNPPVVGADAFDAAGNTLLEVSVAPSAFPKLAIAGNVLANDNDGNGGANGVGVTVVNTGTSATANAGSITLNANGTFSYLPPVGFAGADTFNYTITNGTGTATGTITFTVAQKVWYVKNNGAAGDGRSSSPFNTLVAAQTASAVGDTIFVFNGDGTVTGQNAGITLKDTQHLIGEGVALDVVGTFNTVANPVLFPAGGAPRIGNTAGNGITLASSNTVKGLIANTATGAAIFGSNVGALVISTVAVSTGGAGIDLTGVGLPSVDVALMSLFANGGAKNVNLSGLAGTVNLASGALAGATVRSFDLTNGTANVTWNGTITATGAGVQLVNVNGNSGGTVAFGGLISSGAAGTGGIVLGANPGATINFTGGLTLNTAANVAFTATNGGTVTATQNNTTIVNTITTTTARALNVANATIGAAGLTFRSISSNGGSNNGIILDTTGALGGLSVVGNGNIPTTPGTGGTISNKSGADGSTTTGNAIYLNNTRDVFLGGMTFSGAFDNFGIRGLNVTNFTLYGATMVGTFGTAATFAAPETFGEGAVHFGNDTTNGLLGTGIITGNVFGGSKSRNVAIQNSSGSATLTFTGNSFNLAQAGAGAEQNLIVEARGSANITATVGGGPGFGNFFGGAPSDNMNFTGQTGTTMDVTATNNNFTNTHPDNNVGGGGVTLATQGTMTFDFLNNTVTGADGSTLTLQKASAGTLLAGTISGNTFGTNGVADSASKTGNGIFGSFAGGGTITLDINNNTIQNYTGNAGMYFDNTGGSYTTNLTITGNVVRQPGAGAFAGLAITNGAPDPSGDSVNVCADVRSNDFRTGDPGNANDIIVGSSGNAGGHVFLLPGFAGPVSFANVQNFITTNNNTFGPGTVVTAYSDAPATAAAFQINGLSACPLP